MNRAQRIEKYLWLVTAVVNRMPYSNQEKEDMLSIGTIGLIKAVDRFDELRQVRFTTYAAKCIENEVRYYIRRERQKGCLLLEENRMTDIRNSLEEMSRREEEQDLQDAIQRLKEWDRILIDLQFGFSGPALSQQEAANYLGVSQSKISRERKRILRLLKKALEYS